MKNNIKAINALCNGDFASAQTFFRKGCKTEKSYQSYNNLGVFYIDNGIYLKNGKIISGYSLGKRLVEKSLSMQENPRILNTLGHLEYDSGNLEKALEYWNRAYDLTNNKTILYNIALALFCLDDFEKSLELCESLLNDISLAKQLYNYAYCCAKQKNGEEFYNESELYIEEFDEVEKMEFFYRIGKYREVINLEPEIEKANFGLNEDETLALLDSYIRCGMGKYGIEVILKKHLCFDEDSPYLSYFRSFKKKLLRVLRDSEYREEALENCHFAPSTIDDECEYFGCAMHNTPWE